MANAMASGPSARRALPSVETLQPEPPSEVVAGGEVYETQVLGTPSMAPHHCGM
jgi:hypothetical protein